MNRIKKEQEKIVEKCKLEIRRKYIEGNLDMTINEMRKRLIEAKK